MQQWTRDWNFPPNPPIGEDEWDESFTKSIYFLVTINRHDFPRDDYDGILLAFDDDKYGNLHSEWINDIRLERFINENQPIHFEKTYWGNKLPSKVIYWAHTKDGEWAERIEMPYITK